MISKTIDIVVTSVLQTTAGKMIFGRFIESSAPSAVPPPAPSSPGAPTTADKDDANRRPRPAPQV
jgi:hypothetical protein